MLSAQTDMDMIECPYNKAHRMLRKRLQPHLLKCRLNYPDVELQKCPFNQTHLVPEPEFVHHVTSCPDRKLITQYKYDAVETKEEERIKHEPIECEENWDDTEVEDYDPKKYIATANVLRRPEGHQPALRKAFIKQERKRLGEVDSDEEYREENERKKLAPLSRVKKEEPWSDDEHDDNNGRRKPRTVSPSPPPARRSSPSSSSNSYRKRSRSPLSRGSTRDYYRNRSPMWREPEIYSRRRMSPPLRERYRAASPTPPPPPLLTSTSTRSGRKSPEEPYDLDDDPYYNGGASASASTSTTSSNHGDSPSRRSTNSLSQRYNPYPYDRYNVDYGRAYYALPPSGRGAHRGHPYGRY